MKILKIKQLETWHRKNPLAPPADDILLQCKGFVDEENDEIVGCSLAEYKKSKYFKKIDQKREQEWKRINEIRKIVRQELKAAADRDLPEVRFTADYYK